MTGDDFKYVLVPDLPAFSVGTRVKIVRCNVIYTEVSEEGKYLLRVNTKSFSDSYLRNMDKILIVKAYQQDTHTYSLVQEGDDENTLGAFEYRLEREKNGLEIALEFAQCLSLNFK